ncbi:MAG: hypothetical protein WD939_02345 [Dehalococcoidia bacterium]
MRRDGGDLSALMEPRPVHQASASPEIQERALAQLQSMLDQLQEQPQRSAEIESALRDTSGRLKYGVTKLETEVDRLSHEISRLSSVGTAAPAPSHVEHETDIVAAQPEPAAEQTPAPSIESQFQPGGRATAVVLSGIPDFEALMEVQRGLTGLQQAMGVSVTEYEDGVATLELELRSPASARHIASALRAGTGRQFLVEEADPGANRLRLSFIEHGRAPERPASSRLRPDLWQKA